MTTNEPMSQDEEITMSYVNVNMSITCGEYKGESEYYAQGCFTVSGLSQPVYSVLERAKTPNQAVTNALLSLSRQVNEGYYRIPTPHNHPNIKNERCDMIWEKIDDNK